MTTFTCPRCQATEAQPDATRGVHHRCPATRRYEAYQRDPQVLVREAATGNGDLFAGFPKDGQP